MPRSLPAYFTTLKPFAPYFATGTPMLMYHKLGPRPRGVRLKGLYVGNALFERQLRDLRVAGFRTGPYGRPTEMIGNHDRRIILTFDDGFVNVLQHGLEPLARHGFRAIQFLVADRLGQSNTWDAAKGEAMERLMDEVQAREWLAAGHEIGSHSLTHPFLTHISPAQAREEITASRKKLEDRFGLAIRHFCYPYGDWNPAIRDMVLAAGYETACTTEFGVNHSETPAGELRRIMARHQSLSFKALKMRIKRMMG